MQRKIIQQSPSSLGISLPVNWINDWNLKKGDILEVGVEKGLLEVRPLSYKVSERVVELDASVYGRLTRRKFDNLSKKGYDEIKVLYKKESDLDLVKETLQVEATMFEIIKKEDGVAVCRAISEIDREQLSNLQNRLVFLLKEKVNVMRDYLKSNNPQGLKDLIELEKTNNRLAHLCLRAIHRQPMEEESFIRYTFIYNIEKLANDFKFFAKHQDHKLSKKSKDIILGVMDNLELLIDIYFKYDSKKAVEFYAQRKKIADSCAKGLLDKELVDDHLILHLALSLSEKGIYVLGLLFGLQPQDV